MNYFDLLSGKIKVRETTNSFGPTTVSRRALCARYPKNRQTRSNVGNVKNEVFDIPWQTQGSIAEILRFVDIRLCIPVLFIRTISAHPRK